MSLAKNVARMGERRGAHRVLMGKPEGKRWLGRPRWEDNIERYFKEVRWEDVDWIDLAQDVNKCRAPMNAVIGFHKMLKISGLLDKILAFGEEPWSVELIIINDSNLYRIGSYRHRGCELRSLHLYQSWFSFMLCFPCSIKQLKRCILSKGYQNKKPEPVFCGTKYLIILGVSAIADFNDRRTERKNCGHKWHNYGFCIYQVFQTI